jgi:BASS family bile acid:Na+ symporter
MNLEQLIVLAIKASIMLLVFGLGLQATARDATYLFRKPGLLARSLLSMNVVMPLFAVVVVRMFDLHSAVEIAIVALALAPVPPILPGKQEKAGGAASYAIGLLVAAALFAIVLVPAGVELMGKIFARDVHMTVGSIALIVLLTVLAPLAAGLIVNRLAPAFAARIARPVSLFATVLLVAASLPVLFTAWPAVMSMIGNGTLLVLALFSAVGLAVGHWLGGGDPDNRTVLALATSARHPAVALAIAGANFHEQKAVLAVVVLYLVVGTIVSFPYVLWRKRSHVASAAGMPVRSGMEKL